MRDCRSLLYAAAHDGDVLAAALASPAHAVVADLEDSVAAGDKQRARDVIADSFGGARDGAALWGAQIRSAR